MIKIKLFFFLALVVALLNSILAVPIKNIHQENVFPQKIEGLLSHVQNIAGQISASLPEKKQAVEDIVNQTKQFGQVIIGKIQSEINNKKENVNNLLQQSLAKLGGVSDSLQNLIGPEKVAAINEIKAQLNEKLQTATGEVEKLTNAVHPTLQHTGEALQIFAKDLAAEFSKAVESLKTQVNVLPIESNYGGGENFYY